MKKIWSVLPLAAALCLTSTAEAVYEAKSDTGTEFFDFVGNRRRVETKTPLVDSTVDIEIIDED